MANLKISEGNKGVYKQNLIKSNKVIVSSSKYGYGLFCISPIKRGEIIEECVVMTDRIQHDSPEMQNYVFRGNEVYRDIYDKVLPAGLVTLVNHSFNNNNIDIEQNLNFERLLYVFAIRDIIPGEEILWNYGYHPK